VNPASAGAQACLTQYFKELNDRLIDGFDSREDLLKESSEYQLPDGLFLVANHSGRYVGCGALWRCIDESIHIKRMWVEKEWRGIGVGRRLLTLLECHAKDLGCNRVKLETSHALREAMQLYRSQGYLKTTPSAEETSCDYWMEKRLEDE